MNILISGATGLIGGKLARSFADSGHQVLALRRGTAPPPFWDIDRKIIELGQHQQIDAVINLAGENIAEGCWTAAKKERIRQSRVNGTRLLAKFFAEAEQKPKVMISASGVGFYGDRGDEELTEGSSRGSGFLAEVAAAWEAAAAPAAEAGIRVVNARFGMVLSQQGGGLAHMLRPFRMGLGGVVGSGKQWISWISIRELPEIMEHLIRNEELSGPVNVTAPQPATNRQFTKALGRALHRPTFLPASRVLQAAVFGEMGQELLLASAKARPVKLLKSGYTFKEPDIDTALQAILHERHDA